MHVAIPGVIESYDNDAITATVKPAINNLFNDGSRVTAPLIYGVPVCFPRSLSAAITFPLVKGDEVLLVFSEKSLDEWIASGANANPEDNRRFDLTDAIAIPGCFHSSSGKIPTSKDDLVIQFNEQTIIIKANGNIELGTTTLKLVTENGFTDINTAMTAIATYINNIVSGTVVWPGINTGLGTHLTSKTKAE
jgi:hypothetical protein